MAKMAVRRLLRAAATTRPTNVRVCSCDNVLPARVALYACRCQLLHRDASESSMNADASVVLLRPRVLDSSSQQSVMRGLVVVALLVALFGAACAQLIVKKETLGSRNGVYGVRVSYKKQGASSVTDVKIKDTLPDSLELVSGKLSVSGPAVRAFFRVRCPERHWSACGADWHAYRRRRKGGPSNASSGSGMRTRPGRARHLTRPWWRTARRRVRLARPSTCGARARGLAWPLTLVVAVAAYQGVSAQRLLRAPCRSGVLAGKPHV